MSKKISDAERVVIFFQTADESAALTMQQVIRGIVAGRNFGKASATGEPTAKRAKREPAKPKPVPAAVDGGRAPAPTVEKATPANSNGNKKLNEEATLADALRRSLSSGGAENAGLN